MRAVIANPVIRVKQSGLVRGVRKSKYQLQKQNRFHKASAQIAAVEDSLAMTHHTGRKNKYTTNLCAVIANPCNLISLCGLSLRRSHRLKQSAFARWHKRIPKYKMSSVKAWVLYNSSSTFGSRSFLGNLNYIYPKQKFEIPCFHTPDFSNGLFGQQRKYYFRK